MPSMCWRIRQREATNGGGVVLTRKAPIHLRAAWLGEDAGLCAAATVQGGSKILVGEGGDSRSCDATAAIRPHHGLLLSA